MSLAGWIDRDEKKGYISVHTTDGKVCEAVGYYSQGFAMALIRGEAARHPEGVVIFVGDGFRFFPMSKVSHIAFSVSPALMESHVHDLAGGG